MRLYKVKLKLDSAYASNWQADTIWGHLCWMLRYCYGEDALAEFLTGYEAKTPPLLISNGFPGDLFPRPVLPQAPVHSRDEYAHLKQQKRIPWLDLSEFNQVLNGNSPMVKEKDTLVSASITLKNQINRFSGTTGGDEASTGTLYPFREYHGSTVSIYMKIAEDFLETARELFSNLSKSGYGKRKTAGYGQFTIVSFEEFSGFQLPDRPEGYISLSNFIPARDDPAAGYWDILTKYGRLGEVFAAGGNPHKKPLVMFKAGSCFYTDTLKPCYGRLVKSVSRQYPEVVQYALALPLPFRFTPASN